MAVFLNFPTWVKVTSPIYNSITSITYVAILRVIITINNTSIPSPVIRKKRLLPRVDLNLLRKLRHEEKHQLHHEPLTSPFAVSLLMRLTSIDHDSEHPVIPALIIHFPTRSGIHERANEWAQRSARAKQAGRSQWRSEGCKRMSKRMSEWPYTNIGILHFHLRKPLPSVRSVTTITCIFSSSLSLSTPSLTPPLSLLPLPFSLGKNDGRAYFFPLCLKFRLLLPVFSFKRIKGLKKERRKRRKKKKKREYLKPTLACLYVFWASFEREKGKYTSTKRKLWVWVTDIRE